MRALAFKRKSVEVNGVTVPAAGKVVVGLPGKNLRKSGDLKVYESDRTVMERSGKEMIPRIEEGATIYVERIEDLPGYKTNEESLDLRLNGWVQVQGPGGEVEIPSNKIHYPTYGKVARKRIVPSVESGHVQPDRSTRKRTRTA